MGTYYNQLTKTNLSTIGIVVEAAKIAMAQNTVKFNMNDILFGNMLQAIEMIVCLKILVITSIMNKKNN